MPRGVTRQKTQGVSGRLGARFGSKLMPSSPVPSSLYVRARADARPASKCEGARTGVRRHKGVSVRLGAKFGSKLTASSLVSPSACVRAAVCACTVSAYGAHTSRAEVGSSS